MATYTTYQLGEMVVAAANRYGIPPRVAVEQIRQESSFNPNAVGPATRYGTAKGIAQFIDSTWARYGKGSPYDPVAAIDAWGRYMRDLLRMFNGRIDIALAGYNSGENYAEYRAAAAQGRAINWSVLPAGLQTQTKNYVNSIMSRAGALAGAVAGAVAGGVNNAAAFVAGQLPDSSQLIKVGSIAFLVLLFLKRI